MGRSSQDEAARSRKRIIAVAAKMFRASGVDQVSVSDVMGELGLTNGGFYKHFASKEALAVEAADLAFTESAAAWITVASSQGHGQRSRRAEIVAHYLRPNPATRCPMIAFAPHSAVAEAETPSRMTYRGGVATLLEDFVGHSGGTCADKTRMGGHNAQVLFAAMIGARVLKEAAGDAEWADDLCAAVLKAATTAA